MNEWNCQHCQLPQAASALQYSAQNARMRIIQPLCLECLQRFFPTNEWTHFGPFKAFGMFLTFNQQTPN